MAKYSFTQSGDEIQGILDAVKALPENVANAQRYADEAKGAVDTVVNASTTATNAADEAKNNASIVLRNVAVAVEKAEQATADSRDAITAKNVAVKAAEDAGNIALHPAKIGANGNWYVWSMETEDYVDSGIDASITIRIADVTAIDYGTAPYITNTGTSTDPIFHLFLPRAATISGVTRTSGTGAAGTVDTYTITLQDGNTATFTVYNGKDGAGGDMSASIYDPQGKATDIFAEIETLKTSVSNGKALVAEAVTDKGVTTASNATFAQIAANIGDIITDPSVNDTVTDGGQILSGYTAHSKGRLITGTIPINANGTNSVSMGKDTTGVWAYFPYGFYPQYGNTGNAYIYFPAEQIGNAAAAQILSGYSATSSNGVKIAGAMTDNGAKTASLNAGGSYTIPAGYHNGSGKVTANSLSSQTSATAVAADIISGKTAWVNGSKITGTATKAPTNYFDSSSIVSNAISIYHSGNALNVGEGLLIALVAKTSTSYFEYYAGAVLRLKNINSTTAFYVMDGEADYLNLTSTRSFRHYDSSNTYRNTATVQIGYVGSEKKITYFISNGTLVDAKVYKFNILTGAFI